ncbi:MAG TPA: tyrosine-type recombinase/integrase [Ktedonobacterales bacterium]|nr:tyrosine-type recombinase/integrase [Ktedonobacterales bacterium]
MALTELLLAKDYTPKTVQRRREVLSEFITWANTQGVRHIEEVTRPLVRRYLADLRERPNVRYGGKLSGETQHGRASVVRMYLRFCAREGWLDERVVAFFEMPKTAQKVIQVLSQEQYRLLVSATDACALPGLPLRDKAILALLFDTGMRAHELCALRRDAVTMTPGETFVRVEGKGRKERELGLGKQATLALHRYLSRGRPDSDSPLVFLTRDAKPMTPNGIDRMLYRLRDAAGARRFQGVRVSAHTFRHSFAVHYMRQGSGDIYKLSRLLGHENVHTTERYLRAFQAEDARRASRSVLDGL